MHEYVGTGRCFAGNYEGAKQDFAIRAGLVEKNLAFTPEQLAEICLCVAGELKNSCYAGTNGSGCWRISSAKLSTVSQIWMN